LRPSFRQEEKREKTIIAVDRATVVRAALSSASARSIRSNIADQCRNAHCRLVLPVSSALKPQGPSVKKSELLRALQQELLRHDFDCFIDNPPSIAQGGGGVFVSGCPTCKKQIQYGEPVLAPSRRGCYACFD
jgi:hypothetical protein